MSAQRQAQYVAFDLETTGLLAEVDRVVEIGAIRFGRDGRELGRFEELVNPGRPISPSARAVHGISDSQVAQAPSIAEVLPRFLDFVGYDRETILLAHNAWFDSTFLGRELGRAGLEARDHMIVDTLALARSRLPQLKSHRLDVLARHFGLTGFGHHRALSDSLTVKELWLRMSGPDEPLDRLTSFPILDVRKRISAPMGWEILAAAILRGDRVKLRYDGGTHGMCDREVTPRAFTHRGGTSYLLAFCHIDHFEKSFRLDRVKRYEIVRSFQTHDDPSSKPLPVPRP